MAHGMNDERGTARRITGTCVWSRLADLKETHSRVRPLGNRDSDSARGRRVNDVSDLGVWRSVLSITLMQDPRIVHLMVAITGQILIFNCSSPGP